MKEKDFIDCKHPNYYLVKGMDAEKSCDFQGDYAHLEVPNLQYMGKSRCHCKSLRPSSRPASIISSHSSRMSLQLRRNAKRGQRFNESFVAKPSAALVSGLAYLGQNRTVYRQMEAEKKEKMNETLKETVKEKEAVAAQEGENNKSIKERVMISEIVKDVKSSDCASPCRSLAEDDLDNVKNYIKCLLEAKELANPDAESALNEQNLKRLDGNLSVDYKEYPHSVQNW
ncbi:MAG: hypothetical protein P4M11_11165 [Candidatus Pacebacteria bacterium]|nr:hypothetical protein [Candidatus Paceibacterota bacterium]